MIKLINKYKEIILYLIFGVLATIINLVTYYILTNTFLNPNISIELTIANIISWIVCVTFAYFTNRKYVFESKNKSKIKELINFYKYRLLTLITEIILMLILVNRLGLNDKIIKPIVQIIVIILNYIFSKIFVFKKENKNNLSS